MRSNYKKIGPYIKQIDVRNIDNKITFLRGVSSVYKSLMKSKANTIGANMSKYKIVKQNQFAFNPNTARMGDKIPIALNEGETCIVSQIYPVFEIVDTNKLNPHYLMMWFRRPEFDRYARFKSHGSAREIFDWDEMCNIELPMPTIEKQQEIVTEYNTVVNRIKLNETLNQKLEETAQAIYKEWFVDFNFLNEDGKSYKSSGGKMVYNEELDKEIPEGWKNGVLSDIMIFKNGKTRPKSKGSIPVFGGNGILDFIKEFNNQDVIVIGRVGAYCGSLFRVLGKCWISDNAICGVSKYGYNMYCFDLLKGLNLNERSEGTGQPLLTQGIINNIETEVPNENIIANYEEKSKLLFNKLNIQNKELELMKELEMTILSKMSKI